MEPDEQAWLRRCAEGDGAACRLLVDRHARVAGTIILRTVGRYELVEDLLQETFLRVFRALPEFEGRAKLSTWICTIAQRTALDALRQMQRSPRTQSQQHSPEPVDDNTPEREVSQADSDARVRQALARLPDKYRLPLVHSAIEGLDYDTIAAMLDMPIGTVKTHVFRGKQMLREQLEGLHDSSR